MILELTNAFTKEVTIYSIDEFHGDGSVVKVTARKITEDKFNEIKEKAQEIEELVDTVEEDITMQPVRRKIERRINPKRPSVTKNPNDKLGLRQLDANLKTETVTKVIETQPVDLSSVQVVEQSKHSKISDETDKLVNVLRNNGIVIRERRER